MSAVIVFRLKTSREVKIVKDDSNFDEEKFAKADIWSAQIPVVYCSGCHEIRGESEMIDGKPKCIYCCYE